MLEALVTLEQFEQPLLLIDYPMLYPRVGRPAERSS
jgi:hypothetical protein